MFRKFAQRAALALGALATVAATALSLAPSAGASVSSFPFGPDPRTPTSLTAVVQPAGGLTLTGTLTDAFGNPVAGQLVTFTTNGSSRFLCSDVTDLTGFASCGITAAQRTLIRSTAGGIWYDRFAGNVTLQPTFRAGHI